MKSINIQEKLANFFSNERVLLILDSLREKKGTAELLGIIGKATNMDLICKFSKNSTVYLVNVSKS